QNPACHLARNRWKAGKKLFESVVFFEIIKQRLYRDARSFEYGRPSKDFRIHGNEIIGLHDPNITDVMTSRKWTNSGLRGGLGATIVSIEPARKHRDKCRILQDEVVVEGSE